MGTITRKKYREILNEEDRIRKEHGEKSWSNKSAGGDGSRMQNYGPKKRLYGDYLWHQDRIMFEISYENHLKEKGLPYTPPKTKKEN